MDLYSIISLSIASVLLTASWYILSNSLSKTSLSLSVVSLKLDWLTLLIVDLGLIFLSIVFLNLSGILGDYTLVILLDWGYCY